MFAILMACVYEVDSCVRGYHVYQDTWTPLVGEECALSWRVGVVFPPRPFTSNAFAMDSLALLISFTLGCV